jgi:hypothetical protein
MWTSSVHVRSVLRIAGPPQWKNARDHLGVPERKLTPGRVFRMMPLVDEARASVGSRERGALR